MYLNQLTLETGRLANGQGQLHYEFISLDVDTPPNWKPCEGKYGAASGDLDLRAGLVLPEREAPL